MVFGEQKYQQQYVLVVFVARADVKKAQSQGYWMGVDVCTGGASTMKCCLLVCSVLLLVLRIPHDANDISIDTTIKPPRRKLPTVIVLYELRVHTHAYLVLVD